MKFNQAKRKNSNDFSIPFHQSNFFPQKNDNLEKKTHANQRFRKLKCKKVIYPGEKHITEILKVIKKHPKERKINKARGLMTPKKKYTNAYF